MRGNHRRRPRARNRSGSIPAHAGEPRRSRRSGRWWWVYPRACGGTVASPDHSSRVSGLSPRMRGNRALHGRIPGAWGSIPAHAGEPGQRNRRRLGDGVYPRACGGTAAEKATSRPDLGLSPRMRGNHVPHRPAHIVQGSIPAHAGEPFRRRGEPRRSGVYPRACGGTARARHGFCTRSGLSPRMRGNRGREAGGVGGVGSIPAHAGEPRGPRRGPRRARVYPRACGGTLAVEASR